LLIDSTTLTSKVLIDDPVSNNLAPAWSPDGARLAFSSDRSKIWQIYTANVNQDMTVGQVTQMTSSRASGKGWPSWSPDGSQITYGLSSTSTFMIGKTTGNLVEYSLADGGWPDWSPNLP
jgi:TolB protein